MAATIIQETELIDVSSLSMLLYGPPGVWKTSLAQTCNKPITLDLDRGAHRAFNRKTVMRFETWGDIQEADSAIKPYDTVIVDTVGRALDLLSQDICRANAKHGTAAGGLSLQGYGVLKSRFAGWMSQVRLAGKDVVMICHEKEEKDGDDRYMRPDVQGGSYTEIMKFTDLVGYVRADNVGKRTMDFNPSDRHIGKNAANWKIIDIPNLNDQPTFLAGLLADAKRVIGHTAQASCAVAQAVEAWKDRIDADPTLDELNAMLPELKKVDEGKQTSPIRTQVWAIMLERTSANGVVFDVESKKFKPRVA